MKDADRGLLWVNDTMPGIHRVARKQGFVYVDAKGRTLRSKTELERIQKLAIPPAYVDVWICADPHGHLQATGRDARGRKQYRYHPDWQTQRSESKFSSLLRFGQGLALIRERVHRELASGHTPTHARVLAAIVHVLDTTWVRIGNEAYEQQNGSFGLTTLRQRHSSITGSELKLNFVGKSGIRQKVALNDARVARIVRSCRDLPGQRLFQYLDEMGEVHGVSSSDVNAWLLETSGEAITAKDFRTWHASVLALQMLTTYRAELFDVKHKSPLLAIVGEVALRLGNTPAVCRASYIHPAVLAHADFLENELALSQLQAMRWFKSPIRKRRLRLPERQLLSLLAHKPKQRSIAKTP